MKKTRDLLKKITDTKGKFHAKIGTIKDRNGMDLTEAEDINKKRWWSWKPLQIDDNKWTDTRQGETRHVLITGAELIPKKYSQCKGPKGIILEFSRN